MEVQLWSLLPRPVHQHPFQIQHSMPAVQGCSLIVVVHDDVHDDDVVVVVVVVVASSYDHNKWP